MLKQSSGTVSENEDKRIKTMAEEKPFKAVMKMGIPMVFGMLFMALYNIVDTYFVGLLNDDCQLAAANLSYPVIMILIAISGIVGNGGASYIARCLGAEKNDEAGHTLTIGFELILISALALSLLGMIFLNPTVKLLGAKEDTFVFTKDYVSVMFLGSIFTMGNYAIGQLLRSEGSTFYSMVGMIAGNVANIILDPIFIFSFKMEIKGAAIATVLGNAIGLVLMLYYYVTGKTLLKPSVKQLRFDNIIIKEIMLVGLPHTLEQFFSTASMLVINNLAAGYGSLAVAGMGIANKIMSFGSYIYQGMAGGCQPLIGFNYGAGKTKRLKEILRSGMISIAALEAAVVVLFGVFAPNLIGLFTESEEVIRLGTEALRGFMLMLLFVSPTVITRNFYNAAGKPMYAFGITIVRQIVLYIPFLLLFNRLWGYIGLVHAQPAEELICMIFSLFLLRMTMKKMEAKTDGKF